MAKPERRFVTLAAVAALHGAVLLALLQAGVWRDRGRPPAPKPALEVTLLLPAPAPPSPAAPRIPRPPPRADLPRPRPVPTPEAALQVPAAAALPADPAPSVLAAPIPQEPAASAAVPLQLTLPRSATRRAPALDDPRANTARPTLEAQIAAALGGEGALTEERLSDGVVRFRRGKACVEVHETRDVALDPFNQSVFHKPRLARSC